MSPYGTAASPECPAWNTSSSSATTAPNAGTRSAAPYKPRSRTRSRRRPRRTPGLLAQSDSWQGAWIEEKGRAVAVHTRRAKDPQGAFDALREPLAGLAARHGLMLEPGRLVLEMRPPGVDKGVALREYVDEIGAETVVYGGDDLGDLPAFAAVDTLRGNGHPGLLLCSGTGEVPELAAKADLVLPGPGALTDFLAAVAARLLRAEAPARNAGDTGRPAPASWSFGVSGGEGSMNDGLTDDLTDGLTDDRIQATLELLNEARDLSIEDPRRERLERAASGLFRDGRRKRRSATRGARATADAGIQAGTVMGAPDRTMDAPPADVNPERDDRSVGELGARSAATSARTTTGGSTTSTTGSAPTAPVTTSPAAAPAPI